MAKKVQGTILVNIELFLSIITIVIICIILTWTHGRSTYRSILFTIVVLYIFTLLYFTFVRGGRTGISGVSIKLPIYFIKAIQSGNYSLVTNRSLLNLLLFVPYGFLLPQIISLGCGSRMTASGWSIILGGFLLSLLIETCQLVFQRGVFELDDLVKNTMGTAMGYLIWKGISKRLQKQSMKKESSNANN